VCLDIVKNGAAQISLHSDLISSRNVPGQRSGIDLGKCVFGLHTLQVNHSGLDVAMAHPVLQCPDIDAVPQMLCCESVAEFMEEKMPAVRPLGAFVSVFGDALSAIQFGALGHTLDDHVIFTVGIPF
jgi:hypothetical protein